MCIQFVVPGPHTSKPNKQYPIYPYLLKNPAIARSLQDLSADITYIRMNREFIYLMAIIDWYYYPALSSATDR